jgi:hypothetical protein
VRTAVVTDPDNPNATLTVAAMQDLQGGAQCIDGVCNQLDARDTGAGPGEPCEVTSDCRDLSVCIQKDLLSISFIADSGDASGFCASACSPTAGPDACSPGFVCQEAGHLALGMDPYLMINLQDSSLFEVGGFCFRSCADGVPGNCDTAPGTACGQFDDIDVGGAWNGESMCLPDAVRR